MEFMESADDPVLIDLLNQLVREAGPHFVHYAEFRADFSAREHSEWLSRQPSDMLLQNMQKSVQQALWKHRLFGCEKSKFFADKQLVLSPTYQSFNLLKVSYERGPAAAVAWLHKVWATTYADVRYVVEVHGLSVNKAEHLSNGVTLVPLNEIPDSPQVRRLLAQYPRYLLPFARPFFPPIGAILEVHRVEASESRNGVNNRNAGRSEVLENTVAAFSLVGDASPVIGVAWVEFIDEDLALAEFGEKWSTSRHESDLAGHAPTPLAIDEDGIGWVERYIQLSSDVKCGVDVALERLALARRRSFPGNKAIEAAICLEALLGGEGNQELTYRLRLRAALLLAEGVKERAEISHAVRDLYDLRSKTVHGIVPSPKSLTRDHTRAERGVAICAGSVRAIVKLGRRYEPEEWELSGGHPRRIAD